MPAMLVMYVIPVAMIPAVPFIFLVLLGSGSPRIALAFIAVATTIGISCWIQYRAGKREWIKAHLGERWILTHGTLGGSLVLLVLALICFVLASLSSASGAEGAVVAIVFSVFFGILFMLLAYSTARGYKKFRKSPEAYKKWNEEQNRNNVETLTHLMHTPDFLSEQLLHTLPEVLEQ